MPNYKEMYFKLFRTHCDVMDMLQKAGQETEEMAMGTEEPPVLPAEERGMQGMKTQASKAYAFEACSCYPSTCVFTTLPCAYCWRSFGFSILPVRLRGTGAKMTFLGRL